MKRPRNAAPLLNANALTTIERLRAALGTTAQDLPDEQAASLINSVSAWVETMTGRRLGYATCIERHKPTGRQELSLKQWPINAVARVQIVDPMGPTREDDPHVEGWDFVETGDTGLLYRDCGWTYAGYPYGLEYDAIAAKRQIEVEYDAGYVLPKDWGGDGPQEPRLPADLEALVTSMITQQIALTRNGAAGLRAFSISDVRWDFDKSADPTWSQVVNRYSRLWV